MEFKQGKGENDAPFEDYWSIDKCQCVVFMIEKIEHFGT